MQMMPRWASSRPSTLGMAAAGSPSITANGFILGILGVGLHGLVVLRAARLEVDEDDLAAVGLEVVVGVPAIAS